MAEKQEGQRIQRFLELDTILDMVNWWIMWIIQNNGIMILSQERNDEMVMQKLKEQIVEIKRKEAELKRLEDSQIFILKEKKEEMKEVIDLYNNEDLYFRHPNFDYFSGVGPVLGIEASTNRIFIYNPNTDGVILIAKGEKVDEAEKISWRKLVEEGQFENAMTGLNYLVPMLKDNLKLFDDEISKVKMEIDQSR
ncbi:hypothetical protein ABEP22_03425 [Bacillus safensis]